MTRTQETGGWLVGTPGDPKIGVPEMVQNKPFGEMQ